MRKLRNKRSEVAASSGSHDRWLVSYADLMTLLFAFFVVMYAVSSLNETKYKILTTSLGGAFTHANNVLIKEENLVVDQQTLLVKRLSRKEKKDLETLNKERAQLKLLTTNMLDVMAPLIKSGKVRVYQNTRGIVIEVNASVLFETGSAEINTSSIKTLEEVAKVLINDTHAIVVEGFTDDVPIKSNMYPSNWELSASRAGAVVRLFIDSGVDKGRLTATGHAENNQVDTNETNEGRSRNRRVNIVVESTPKN